MPTYKVSVTNNWTRGPRGMPFEYVGTFATKREAESALESKLNQLYGSNWIRQPSGQYTHVRSVGG